MLPADEAAHATKVLRMNVGDSFFLLDGKGNIAEAEITLMDKKSVCYELLNVTHHPKPWKGRLHVATKPFIEYIKNIFNEYICIYVIQIKMYPFRSNVAKSEQNLTKIH